MINGGMIWQRVKERGVFDLCIKVEGSYCTCIGRHHVGCMGFICLLWQNVRVNDRCGQRFITQRCGVPLSVLFMMMMQAIIIIRCLVLLP